MAFKSKSKNLKKIIFWVTFGSLRVRLLRKTKKPKQNCAILFWQAFFYRSKVTGFAVFGGWPCFKNLIVVCWIKIFWCCPKGGYTYFLWSRRFWFWSWGRVSICFVPKTLSFCHECQKTLSFCHERKAKLEWVSKVKLESDF